MRDLAQSGSPFSSILMTSTHMEGMAFGGALSTKFAVGLKRDELVLCVDCLQRLLFFGVGSQPDVTVSVIVVLGSLQQCGVWV